MSCTLLLSAPERDVKPDPPNLERERMIAELRERYLAGSLDDALMPEEPGLERLLFELFPDLAPRSNVVELAPRGDVASEVLPAVEKVSKG